MINNFGFEQFADIPYAAYEKTITDDLSVSITPTPNVNTACVVFYTKFGDICKNYMFSFTEGPTDEDVVNMFKFINDYLIPYFNNPCDETGNVLDEKRKELFPNLRTTNCFHNS